MPWISKSALDALEETMRTPDPNDHWWNRAEADPRSSGKVREDLTEAMLKQRLTEALGLLRAIRRQERER